jgi:AraC-like DNA-binding protein
VELGIAEEIVGAVREAIGQLGFDIATFKGAAAGTLLVPGAVADALLDQAAEFLLDEALGLNLATRIAIGSLGTLDYGLTTSATLREALERVSRYYSIATQRARIELVEDGPSARLVYHRVAGVDHSRHWIEFAFALIATRIRQTLGLDEQLAFTRVSFRHPAPTRQDTHDEFFGTRVEFGASEEWLAFDAALLDQPLRTASRSLAELLERRLRELAPQMGAGDPELDRIRRTLALLLDTGVSDLESLATKLDLSTRTLQRMLRDRKTSHTQLVDELRRARAVALLEAGERVATVATRLGFSDPSAFFRAYRRWTGKSPTGARKP